MTKNSHIHEDGKVGRYNDTSTKHFSIDSYNLKSLLFQFGNDIFITFEIPSIRIVYNRLVSKINILLLFCPTVGPCLNIPIHFNSNQMSMINFTNSRSKNNDSNFSTQISVAQPQHLLQRINLP